MLLTYVDESYTDRWYWIGALLVPEAVAIPLSTALDEVMTDAAKAYGIDRAAELHGYDLFQRRTAWARVPPRARIAVYNAALKAIGTYDVTVILRGVDRHGLTRRYGLTRPAHEVVLSHLLERVDGYAAMRDELALVIADEVDNPASHRSDLTRYRVDGTGATVPGGSAGSWTPCTSPRRTPPGWCRPSTWSPSCSAGWRAGRARILGRRRRTRGCGPGSSRAGTTRGAGIRPGGRRTKGPPESGP
ncbi:hypothetical protein O7630_30730 [Micromonospora sp. WMMD718]|uniref:hypothetical protein n=1 Tax=Micromonospora sp. WMMD718 TaxID=3016098 RepID=UPI002415F1C4|nr:hypothetical protein [Micromonospora sp. WMMD718]MDG4755319.1 hypothetical protein [Micromonospora sp. WMMD718]